MERIEEVRNDGLLGGIEPHMAALSGQLTLRHATSDHIDAAIAKTPKALTLELARSASQSLVFSMPRVFLSRPKVGIEGPGGISVTYDWIAAQGTDGSAMVTATLINAVEAY